MNYIAIDAHSSTCTMCVLDNKGCEKDSSQIETNGRNEGTKNSSGPKVSILVRGHIYKLLIIANNFNFRSSFVIR